MNRRKLFLGIGCFSAMARASSAAVNDQLFKMTSIALYLPDHAMAERGPSTELLVAYIKALVSRANEVLASQPPGPGVSGAVVMGLKPPNQSRMWLVVGDKTRKADVLSILKGPLEGVPAPAVNGLNAFAINFDLWGGGVRPVMPLPLPDEWLPVMTGSILPDGPLKALWPD
jgi:hypothetical protein